MIQVDNITKRYGKHIAVDHATFTVNAGEILGFLGPNGAGKSTTMNIITGYLSATEGTVRIDDIDVLEKPEEAKRRIGYLPEFPPLYLDMTVSDYLTFVYELKKVKKTERAKDLNRILDLVMIGDVRSRLIKNLSKGYRQRVGMAQALIGNPPVLILDEPTIGLDPHQNKEIRSVITNLGKQHTILMSSHVLSEVSAVCSRVLIINKGKIVASDTPEQLAKRLLGQGRLAVRVAGPERPVIAMVEGIDGVDNVVPQQSPEPNTVEFIVESAQNVDVRREIFQAMSKKDYPILMMRSHDITLEEIFLQLTADPEEAQAQ